MTKSYRYVNAINASDCLSRSYGSNFVNISIRARKDIEKPVLISVINRKEIQLIYDEDTNQ